MHRFLPLALAGVLALVSSTAHAQNLLTNPAFDDNLAGWTQANYSPQWNGADANGSTQSGSLRGVVPGGVPQGGDIVTQCVQVTPSTEYDLSAKVRLQQVELQVFGWFIFASANCSGPHLAAESWYGRGGQPNAWHTVHSLIHTPATAHSILVGLYATTQFGSNAAHTVHFDDAYFGPAAPATCNGSNTTLCLDYVPGDRRFLVRATYATTQSGGLQGNGNAVSLTPQGINRGGLFWFFAADNPELLVKVLDGCAATEFLWVFISAGTNVGVNLFIADTDTGAVAFFHNPDLGAFPAIQNIFAIPCPP